MSKFRKGDRVRINKVTTWSFPIGTTGTVDDNSNCPIVVLDNINGDNRWPYNEDNLELIPNGETVVKRRTFKLTKELPELAKGALVQEKCDDGTQDYIALDNSQIKYALEDGRKSLTYPRKAVEDEPNYFVEVFAVEPAYMTQDELDQFEAFKISAKKPAKRTVKAPVKKPAGRPRKTPVTRAKKATKVA